MKRGYLTGLLGLAILGAYSISKMRLRLWPPKAGAGEKTADMQASKIKPQPTPGELLREQLRDATSPQELSECIDERIPHDNCRRPVIEQTILPPTPP